MRIAHISSSINPISGGTATAVCAMAAAQAAAGMRVSLLATWQSASGEEAAQKLRAKGVQARVIGPAQGALSRHPDLPCAVEEVLDQCDVVHIHALWEEIQHRAAKQSRRMNIPFLFSPHGMLDPWSLGQSKWKKKLYMHWRLLRDLNEAAAIHFTSQREAELAARLGLKAQRLVEPLGIDLAEFENLPARGSFAAKHPELTGKRVLLFLSRLHHKKGLDLLIPAFAQSAPDDWAMVIAGPDEGYLETVRRLVKQHGLENRVVFPGMLYGQERLAALADADLFVLPSYQENFGVSVAEALAAAKAVIVSDQVNIHPYISAGQVGAVVPTQVEALSNALREWMRNEPLRKQAEARAVELVRRQFDWRVIAQHWRDHYQRIIQSKRPSP